MARTRFKANLAGFAELRSHPALVGAMESAAKNAAAGTPYDVEAWPHEGRRSGPRTSVQIWARSDEARKRVNDDPGDLAAVLGRVGL